MYSNESWPRFTIFADPYVVKDDIATIFDDLEGRPREETQLEGSEFVEWSGLSLSVITAGSFFIAGNVRDATRSGELTIAAFMYIVTVVWGEYDQYPYKAGGYRQTVKAPSESGERSVKPSEAKTGIHQLIERIKKDVKKQIKECQVCINKRDGH